MESFNQLTESDYKILKNGVCTNVEEDGVVVAQHFHFVGACFTGLWKKKMTKGQIARRDELNKKNKANKENLRLVKSRKYATKNPSIFARIIDDEWNFILASDNHNADDKIFVEEQNRKRIKVPRLSIERNQPSLRTPNEPNQNDNVELGQNQSNSEMHVNVSNNSGYLHMRARMRNREQHSTNGNINVTQHSLSDNEDSTRLFRQHMDEVREMRERFIARYTRRIGRDLITERLAQEAYDQQQREIALAIGLARNHGYLDSHARMANRINHLEHGNIMQVIHVTAIGTIVFDDLCTNYTELVKNLLRARIDQEDRDIEEQLQPLLFGKPSDCKVFEILSRIWWDQFNNPTIVLPMHFMSSFENLDISKEYAIVERFKILSLPPKVHCEKENTKRNSKRYQPSGNDRLLRLQARHPELAKSIIAKQEKQRLEKIYAKQNQQRIENSNKMIKKLDLHGFSIPVKVTFPQFQEITQKALNAVPKQFRNNIHWVDIFASLWTLTHPADYAARWNAIRILYINFKVEGMEFAVFAALIFKLYKHFEGRTEVVCPKIHKEMASVHYVESSPVSIIVTLILTVLFKQEPRKNTVEKIISSFKDIPSASTGMEMVICAASKTLDYISGACDDEWSFEGRLNKLHTNVKKLLSEDGQRRLKEERGAFEEVYNMKVESLYLAQFVRHNTKEGMLINRLSFEINTQYTKVQLFGPSGHGYRKRPVVLHLVGAAGIGKTRLINYVSADTISLILQLENEKYCKEEYKEELLEKVKNYEQFVYFRPVGLKYQQNFKSHASKIYVCDDANQIIPSFQSGEMTYPMEVIHLNNSHDHMLNVAELERKADALFKSSLVIATDNISKPDLHYLVCEDAYYRRIDFTFTVSLKPEYRRVRITNGKEKYEVDVSKIDPNESNTFIYEFIDEHNIKYTYEEMIEMLESKMIDVAQEHVRDIEVFRNRAVTRFERRKFNLTSPLALEMAEHFKEKIDGTSTVLYNKGKESVEITGESRSTVHGFITKVKRVSRDLKNKFTDKVEDAQEALQPKRNLTLGERYDEMKNTIRMFFISLLLTYVSWPTITKWEKRIKKTRTYIQENKDFILATTGVLSAVLLAYSYVRTKEKVKNKPEKRREDKEKHGKYDGGQPTKSAPKGRKPPKTPIKSIPIAYSGEGASVERIDDINKFLRTPQVEMACQRAYSVAKSLISNSYYIYACYEKDGKIECAGLRGFFIKDRIFVTNRHLIPNNKQEFKTVKFNLYNRFCEYEDIPVEKTTINTFAHSDDENSMYYDVIWIDFGRVNMKSHIDLTKMSSNGGCDNFVSEDELDNLFGTKIMVCTLSIAAEFAAIDHKAAFTGRSAWYFEMQHTKVTKVNFEAIELLGRDNEDLYTHKTLEYPMQSVPGYCGSVIVGNDSEYPGKILGIHMAGYCNVDKSYGQIITKEMIESITQLGVHMQRIEGNYVTHIRADEFSFLRTVPHVLRSPTKTKLRKSILHNIVFESQKEPAHLSMAPDGEHVVNKSMRKYLTTHQTLNRRSESIFGSILYSKLRPGRKIRELTRIEAIKGIEDNEYICGINRKSSAGYPLNVETRKQGKHEYLGEGDEWILNHPRVNELISDFENSVKRNERPDVIFVATIKDELIKKSKADAYKSRVFAAAPLHFTILFREKYLDYFATVMENKISNYSLVGVNMYSKDVDDIVNLLLEVAPKKSKQFLAGDFTNFDGTLNLNLLWKVYDIIEYFYNNRKSPFCQALWNELVDSQQLFGNTVIHVARGQPSGNPATTIINTLYNIGLCYMVLFEVLDEIGTEEAMKIQENLNSYYRGVYYGDDNLHSFHKDFVAILDPNMITEVMRRYGHVYTTDSKDSVHFEYKYLSEVTILKRHFVYDTYYNRWIAPLELVSIFEPINWDKIKDSQYEMKEIQMQVNIRTAIRELSLHSTEIFDEYVPKLLDAAMKFDLALDSECFYDQYTLRRIVRNSDGLLFFSNDYFKQAEPDFDLDEYLTLSERGIAIQLGGRLGSSPPKDSQKPMCHLFNPTVNTQQWIANTYEEEKQNKNNKIAHMSNGNYSFVGSGGNGAVIPFQIPAISQDSIVSISLSSSADSERSGTVLISSDWFDIGTRFESQTTATLQLTSKPRGVTNATATITTTVTSMCRFVFTLNTSPPLHTNATIEEPVWVTQYEHPNAMSLKPQVHMLRHVSSHSQNPEQRQIVTLDTVMDLKPETVPKMIELNMEKLAVMKEKRDHSIKDVLSRMYTILDIDLPPGGTTNDLVKDIDVLSEFLTQNNVSAKLDGFTFLRTNFIVTILTRTLMTTSGGIIASFYPQLSNLASRSKNIMQASQTPNKRISVSGSEGIELKIPFISAFYGKNLITGSGDIGHVVIKLLTSLNINPTSLRVFIQADENDIEVSYPTFAAGPNAQENIAKQIQKLQERQQQLLNDARDRIIRVDNAQVLAQNVAKRMNLPDVISKPQVHMEKGTSKSNVISVKWQPATNHINKNGEDVSHYMTLSKNNHITVENEFGTTKDEMTVEHIAKSKQIIGVRRITTAMRPGHIIYARPCSIIDFMSAAGEVTMTHQTWLAMAAQKWKATLDFEMKLYLNQFHSVTLTFIFNPGDQGEFQEGQELPFDLLNKADRLLVELDGQRDTAAFQIKPAMNTAMKSVPTSRLGNVTANALTWTQDCYSEECSYGMFYIAGELTLKSAQGVVPFVDATIDFSVEDLCLSDPSEFIQLVPMVHCDKPRVHGEKSGITTETAEMSVVETRSEHYDNPTQNVDNVADTSKKNTIDDVLGDSINHVADILSTYTPFAPVVTVSNGQALAVEIYAFRTLSDLATASQFKYHDWIDYFSAGYAYYKGKMNMRLGKTTDQQGPFGEVNTTSRRNPVANIGSTSGTGLVTFAAPNPAKSGSRVLPLFKEECVPQINIPYYQSFHMSRVTNSNTFNSANQPKLVVFRPYNTEQVRISRAIDKDFRFGFLTALPAFQLVSGSIYD